MSDRWTDPPTDKTATNAPPTMPGVEPTFASPLVNEALAALQTASQVALDEEMQLVGERSSWQPESWLRQRCWETLADAAFASEAFTVADQLTERLPFTRLQALYRLSHQLSSRPALEPLLQHELQQWHYRFFHTHPEEANQIEPLLLLATSAALTGNASMAATCLERLDHVPKGWERVVARPESRDQLALCLIHIGPHPLTNDLINVAIRRFDDTGTQLLFALTTKLTEELSREELPDSDSPDHLFDVRKAERLMAHCLETVQFATITSLQSRRVAAMIWAQAGQVDQVLAQVTVIENVQAAQRETGYSVEKEDLTVLRQVKRTNANSDVDFLAYTLRNAVDIMPLQRLSREERIALADRLALLGIRSDGWTAASVTATLVRLGALRYAIEVTDHISPRDPSRSEGWLMLVRSLMAAGETAMATEQAERALTWAMSLEERNPERALLWGLAEIYLHHHQPQAALQFLDRWREPTGWRQHWRKWLGEQVDDDELRNRRLRFQALLQSTQLAKIVESKAADRSDEETTTASPTMKQNSMVQDNARQDTAGQDTTKEIATHLRMLRRVAPRLLDGEALIQFYMDGLLRPLLHAGDAQSAWSLLPDVRMALLATGGNRHAVRVSEVTNLLGDHLLAAATATSQPDATARNILESFLRDLWRESADRGVWQTVHAIEGTLPTLLQLEGPHALVTIARGN